MNCVSRLNNNIIYDFITKLVIRLNSYKRHLIFLLNNRTVFQLFKRIISVAQVFSY